MSVLTLVFENCESVAIGYENISSVVVTDVTEQVFYNRFGEIQVTKQAKKALLSFDNLTKETTDRINKYRDITQVFFGGSVYHIDWPDDAMYDNPQQKNRTSGTRLDIYINCGAVDDIP